MKKGQKETAGKEEPLRKSIQKGLVEAFADLNKVLKNLKTWTPSTKRF
jgi:hypothetical protein